jgi:hypothetical protein
VAMMEGQTELKSVTYLFITFFDQSSLSRQDIGDKGVIALCKALQRNQTVKKIE